MLARSWCLFVFVIMLLNVREEGVREPIGRSTSSSSAVPLFLALLAEVAVVIRIRQTCRLRPIADPERRCRSIDSHSGRSNRLPT
jgi:NADH:ubiquinone oxidoreductase subunit 6 (subunit J)